MNPWIYILVGGLLETVWALCMKLSDVFTDPFWTVMTIVFIPVSVIFLNKGLAKGLPPGICYTVWVGMGAIGSFVFGALLLGESVTMIRAILIMMIIVGVFGIENAGKKGNEAA